MYICCLGLGASSIWDCRRNSLSMSEINPPLEAFFGIFPSFTPRKNRTFTCLKRVRSMSPTTTLSTFWGMVPTWISPNPASRISANSCRSMVSSPSRLYTWSKSSITRR